MAERQKGWTDSRIKSEKLPAGKTDVRKAIEKGLFLRLRAGPTPQNPRKTFEYRAQVNGKRRYLTLGTYSLRFTLAQAKLKLAELQAIQAEARIGDTDHPVIEARQKRKARLADPTFDELFDEFVQDKKLGSSRKGGRPVRQRTIDILQQAYDLDIRGNIGDSRVSRITRDALKGCFEAALRRGSPGMAAQVYRTLRGLVRFALKRGTLATDPMAGLENPRPYKPPATPAEVVAATDDEIIALFRVLADSDVSTSVQLAILMQLLTGARPSEVREAKLSEFNLTAGVWRIPAERVKSDRPFEIALSPQAIQVVKIARKLPRLEPYLFPGAKGGAMEKLAVTRALSRLEDRLRTAGCRKLRPHDLRRTFRTMLSRLKVPSHVAIMCMHHANKDVLERVYDGHDLRPEMADAWLKAGNHLATLLGAAGYSAQP